MKRISQIAAAAVLMIAPALAQAAQERLIDSIKGPDLFATYCAVCHGADAKGNGAVAATLKVAPPDLTKFAVRNGGKFPRARLNGIISGEVPIVKGHGTKEMPIWGPIFSEVTRDQDLGRVRIDNLARYIESIQVK
jgi:mono/diheme cytochrome c family protein